MNNECYDCEANACKCNTCNSVKLHSTKIKEQSVLCQRMNQYITNFKSNPAHAISYVDFSWLFEKISPLTDKMPGLSMLIPDTIIFKDAKAQYIAKYDKDKEHIIRVTNPTKLNLQYLSKTFITYSTNDQLMEASVIPKSPRDSGSNESLLKLSKLKSTFSTIEDKNTVRTLPLKVIFREKNAKLERSYTHEDSFLEEKCFAENEKYFRRQTRAGQKSEFWMKFQALQHYVKPWPMQTEVFHFVAPINEFRNYQEIEYAMEDFGNLELLRTNKDKYLENQCYKIAFYINKLYGIEILRMKAEFIIEKKDDLPTNVWFMGAFPTVIRCLHEFERTIKIQKINLTKKDAKDSLRKSLDDHHSIRKKLGASQIERITDSMKKHYEFLKDVTGLRKEIEEAPENSKSDSIFSQLRPCSPYKLTQLLSEDFNPKEIMQEPIFNLDNVPLNSIRKAFLFNEPIIVPKSKWRDYRKEFESPSQCLTPSKQRYTRSASTKKLSSPLMRLKQIQMTEKRLAAKSAQKLRGFTRPTSNRVSFRSSFGEK